MNMRITSSIFEKAGHVSKSCVVKPVVVITETTWKDEARSARVTARRRS
jgi:hypothetical protein